jgi:hypothetical protein
MPSRHLYMIQENLIWMPEWVHTWQRDIESKILGVFFFPLNLIGKVLDPAIVAIWSKNLNFAHAASAANNNWSRH